MLARCRRRTFFDPRAEAVVPIGHVWNSAIRCFSGRRVVVVRQIGNFFFLFGAVIVPHFAAQ